MRSLISTSTSVLCLLLVTACGDDGGNGGDDGQGTDIPACRPELRPVVMVHGFLASADTWTAFSRRLEGNYYCPDHLFALDWNTITNREAARADLAALVDRALAATGAGQVDLVGHSAGGGLVYEYLADPANAAKVATYVNIASNPAFAGGEATLPGPPETPVTTLNLYSTADTVVDVGEIPGAINIVLNTEDHIECATSDKAFTDVYAFLAGGKQPRTLDLAEGHPYDPELPRIVSGKALTMGENRPVPGWTVRVYEVDPATGARLATAPDATFTVAADGSWGPFEAKPETYYEFHLAGTEAGDREVHYYREPFVASNRFVRLRAIPGAGTLVGGIFSIIPFVGDQSVVITLSESQAVVSGRDTLVVDGETLSTPELAAADKTAIAFFLFDEGADGVPGGEVATFKNVTDLFLKALDRVVASGERTLTATLNDRTLSFPAWSGDPDGAIVATFD